MKPFLCLLFQAFLLLVSSPSPLRAQEMTLTTGSEQAREAYLQGLTMMEKFRFEEARPYFDQAIAADPKFALGHLYRGLTAGSQTELLAHIGHAVALSEGASEGERLLIRAYEAQSEGDLAKRLQLAQELAGKYPNDKRTAYLVGLWQQDDAAAIEQFERAIELDPAYAPAYNLLGYAYRDQGDYAKAEEAFKNYLRLQPDEPNPHDSVADLYMKMGRFDEAISHYQMALERSPSFTLSQHKIGVSLDLLGRHEEARAAYQKRLAVETTPAGRAAATLGLSDSYLYEGNYAQALQRLDEMIRIADEEALMPQPLWGRLRKAWIALEGGMLEEAGTYLTAARHYFETHEVPQATAKNFRGQALFTEGLLGARRGDAEAALAAAAAFRALMETQSGGVSADQYHELMGHLHLQKGNHALAASHFAEADQNDPYVLYYAALAEDRAGNAARAAELMRRAADWNQDDIGYALVRSRARAGVQPQAGASMQR